MTSILKALRVRMPNYMSQQVLDFVCKDKLEAILQELEYYIRTNMYHQPEKKKLMRQLLDEIDSTGMDATLPLYFKDILVTRPLKLGVEVNYSCRDGLRTYCTFTYKDIFTPNAPAGSTIRIEWCFSKKRSKRNIITVKTKNNVFRIRDSSSQSEGGLWTHHPNSEIQFILRLLHAHYPNQFSDCIQKLLLSNSWQNIKQSMGIILSINIQKKHIPVHIEVKALSDNRDMMNFSHRI